jgi:hypothetical protein
VEDSGGPGQSPDAERDSRIGEYLVARGRVQLPTFALGVRFLSCKSMLPIAARCGKYPHIHWAFAHSHRVKLLQGDAGFTGTKYPKSIPIAQSEVIPCQGRLPL